LRHLKISVGDNPNTASAYATTPNGTRYAVCTTIQCSYKPVSNSVPLTVVPQATQVTTPTKTPEQMQEETEDSGYLRPPEPRFSLWFPWFRLHFVGVYEGQDIIDIGLSPIPFADYFYVQQNHPVWNKVKEWLAKISFNVIVGIAATWGALWLLSHYGPIAFGAALAGYFAYRWYSLRALSWDSVESLWISVISALVSLEISVFQSVPVLLTFIFTAVLAGAAAVRSLPYGFLCKLITVPINMVLLFTTIMRLASLGAI